jgi:hypothetical protein
LCLGLSSLSYGGFGFKRDLKTKTRRREDMDLPRWEDTWEGRKAAAAEQAAREAAGGGEGGQGRGGESGGADQQQQQ